MKKKKNIPPVIKQKILKMLLNKSSMYYQQKIEAENLRDIENQISQIKNEY